MTGRTDPLFQKGPESTFTITVIRGGLGSCKYHIDCITIAEWPPLDPQCHLAAIKAPRISCRFLEGGYDFLLEQYQLPQRTLSPAERLAAQVFGSTQYRSTTLDGLSWLGSGTQADAKGARCLERKLENYIIDGPQGRDTHPFIPLWPGPA